MQLAEAQQYATDRYKLLAAQLPDAQYRVNLIIEELRNKHNFDTLTFSVQHRGYVRVKSVEFPCNTNGNLMSYNFY